MTDCSTNGIDSSGKKLYATIEKTMYLTSKTEIDHFDEIRTIDVFKLLER